MEKDIKSSTSKSTPVQSVTRALKILKIIGNAKNPVQINEITKISKLNRTTVWRLASSLEEEGFIDKDAITNGYIVGYELYKILSQQDQYDFLKRISRKPLEDLQKKVDETVLLGVQKSNGVLTIDQVDPDYAVRLIDYTNSLSPLTCTSNGKLILSLFSQETLQIFLDQPLKKYSSNTITDRKILMAELDKIREDGVGYTFGELDESENAISAPVFDKSGSLLACITIGGPSFRLPKERLVGFRDLILSTAKEIESLL